MAFRHRSTGLSLLVFILLATVGAVRPEAAPAENWPHWRGPRFDGTSLETGLPDSWSPTENVRWRLELPGPAASTPIVWGDRIFLTSTREDSGELLVLAIGRDGEILWQREVDRGELQLMAQFRHETSPASPSPVTDGRHVWALFGTGKLVCLDFDGRLVWETDLAARYGRPNMYFGLSMSPLLHGERLYLQLLHADAQLVVALDTASGDEAWRVERPTDARIEALHSYASPVPLGDTVVIHGADYVTGHRMADGVEVWRHGTLNPAESYNPNFRLVATPVVTPDGLLVVPTAKRGPVVGLRPDGAAGSISPDSSHLAWKLDRGTPDVPSPLVHDGLVYLSGERGTLSVLDATDGAVVYDERVHQVAHRASPVLADGKLLLTGTDGTVTVIRPGREPEVVARNELGEYIAASPAVSGGTIYLRTYEALYAIGLPGEAAAAAGGEVEATEPATHLDIRIDPLIELFFSVRSQAARLDEPARPGFAAAVTATRGIQEGMGAWGGWGPVDARVLAAGEVSKLHGVFAEISDPMFRRGREIRVREHALALASALEELWPRFLESIWPERAAANGARLAEVEERFVPRHREALGFMMASLGIEDPEVSVPFYLVTDIHPPGASTYYLADGQLAAVLGLEEAGGGEHLFETILHEATHALDLASRGEGSAFATLRELLAERGLGRRDTLYHDVPHTLMFVQAAETTRRFYDPEHRDYGDVSGAYGRSSNAVEYVRPIWRRYLAGEIERDEALRRIAAAAPVAAAAP